MNCGCSRCGRIWDYCECPDEIIHSTVLGQDRDLVEVPVEEDLGAHYRNEFKGLEIDVYRVLQIFGVTDPVAQDIVKELLRGAKKGHTMEFV